MGNCIRRGRPTEDERSEERTVGTTLNLPTNEADSSQLQPYQLPKERGLETHVKSLQNKRFSFIPRIYKSEKFEGVFDPTNQQNYDTTVSFKNIEIPVNKSVLKDTCEYFRMRLTHCFKESRTDSLNIEFDVTVATLKQILDYLHTGVIELSPDDLADVTKTADFLLLEELKKACFDVYKENIDCETVDYIHNIANHYSFHDVSKAALSFKEKHFRAVFESGLFRSWKLNFIQEILLSNLVVVLNEKKVLIFVFAWLTTDYETRSGDAVGLLRKLRYSFLKKENLDEVADENQNRQLALHLYDVAREFSGTTRPKRAYLTGLYMYRMNSNKEWQFEHYLPDTGAVRILNSPPPYIQFGAIVVNNDQIYHLSQNFSFADFQVYDPSKDIWSRLASMKFPILIEWIVHCKLLLCSFKDEIFAFMNIIDIRSQKRINVGRIYSVKSDSWRPLPRKIRTVEPFQTATACGDSIYLLGSECNVLFQYTPSRKVWTEIICPIDHLRHNAISYNSKILFTPRRFDPNAFHSIHCHQLMIIFCTRTKQFQEECSYVNQPPSSTVLFNKSIYLFRGERDIMKVEKIDAELMDEIGEPNRIQLPDLNSSHSCTHVLASLDF